MTLLESSKNSVLFCLFGDADLEGCLHEGRGPNRKCQEGLRGLCSLKDSRPDACTLTLCPRGVRTGAAGAVRFITSAMSLGQDDCTQSEPPWT